MALASWCRPPGASQIVKQKGTQPCAEWHIVRARKKEGEGLVLLLEQPAPRRPDRLQQDSSYLFMRAEPGTYNPFP
jgi:hypothetical protein